MDNSPLVRDILHENVGVVIVQLIAGQNIHAPGVSESGDYFMTLQTSGALFDSSLDQSNTAMFTNMQTVIHDYRNIAITNISGGEAIQEPQTFSIRRSGSLLAQSGRLVLETADPNSLEQYAQSQGFALYQAYLRPDKTQDEVEHTLKFDQLKDYAVIYLNGQVVTTYEATSQPEKIFSLPRIERPGKLQILVESLGHNQNLDPTGIFGDVHFDDKLVRSWVVRLLPIDGLTERGTSSSV